MTCACPPHPATEEGGAQERGPDAGTVCSFAAPPYHLQGPPAGNILHTAHSSYPPAPLCSVCDTLVLTAPEIQILKLLYSPPLLPQPIWQLFPSYTSHTASQKFITRAQWIRITCYFHQPPHFLLLLFLTRGYMVPGGVPQEHCQQVQVL